MTNQKSNKELVAAGHAFAIAQGADAPLTEIAKLVSDLATRLDVMTLRANLLAAENAEVKKFISQQCFVNRCGVFEEPEGYELETPATDAILNAVRAEGVGLYAQALRRQQEDAVTESEHRHTLLGRAAVFAEEFANQLRAGKDGE